MQREEKSERSRRQVLDAALDLFSRQGYRATTIREIAEGAGVSIGNVYHHFPDKETIFRELLEELWAITDSRKFPYRRAVVSGQFPDNLESLAQAARDSVREFRQHFTLIYVDVIEFEGTHIRKFYGEMPQRFADVLGRNGALEMMAKRLRPGVSPVFALMMTTRMFFSYFVLEILFHVPEPFGQDAKQVVRGMVDILRNGMAECDVER